TFTGKVERDVVSRWLGGVRLGSLRALSELWRVQLRRGVQVRIPPCAAIPSWLVYNSPVTIRHHPTHRDKEHLVARHWLVLTCLLGGVHVACHLNPVTERMHDLQRRSCAE